MHGAVDGTQEPILHIERYLVIVVGIAFLVHEIEPVFNDRRESAVLKIDIAVQVRSTIACKVNTKSRRHCDSLLNLAPFTTMAKKVAAQASKRCCWAIVSSTTSKLQPVCKTMPTEIAILDVFQNLKHPYSNGLLKFKDSNIIR